jgi:hypothetical protein
VTRVRTLKPTTAAVYADYIDKDLIPAPMNLSQEFLRFRRHVAKGCWVPS